MPNIIGDFTVKQLLDLNIVLDQWLKDNPREINLAQAMGLSGYTNNHDTRVSVIHLQDAIIAGLEARDTLDQLEKDSDPNLKAFMDSSFSTVDSLTNLSYIDEPERIISDPEQAVNLQFFYEDEAILEVVDPQVAPNKKDWIWIEDYRYQVFSVEITYTSGAIFYRVNVGNRIYKDEDV